MSNKFEQLLDYIVNEEMDKANELFHEIVVEKSREIYENLIAEELEEEEMDEGAEEEMDEGAEEEEMDEGAEEEEMDEGAEEELEDSYMMDAEEDEAEKHDFAPGDATDDFGADTMGDEEPSEDEAMMDIKNAIDELEAAFAELQAAQGDTDDDEFDADDDEFDTDDEGDEEATDEIMGQPAFEGKRMTREYVEKVGNDWEKSSSMKAQGQYVGAGTGEKDGSPVDGKSPVSSGKGKPTTGADAKNILGSVNAAGEGVNTGTKPAGKAGGLSPEKGEFAGSDWKANSAPGGKAGVKNLKKQGAGYPGNNKTASPVGSGTGEKAGQTSVGAVKSPLTGAPNRNK